MSPLCELSVTLPIWIKINLKARQISWSYSNLESKHFTSQDTSRHYTDKNFKESTRLITNKTTTQWRTIFLKFSRYPDLGQPLKLCIPKILISFFKMLSFRGIMYESPPNRNNEQSQNKISPWNLTEIERKLNWSRKGTEKAELRSYLLHSQLLGYLLLKSLFTEVWKRRLLQLLSPFGSHSWSNV